MTYRTFTRAIQLFKIALLLSLTVTTAKAQNVFYGNLLPSDSGALDIGASDLHWQTIYVDNIVPPVSGSGIWKLSGSNVSLLDSSDNVGIGTSAPAAKLYISGDFYQQEVDSSNNYIIVQSNQTAGLSVGTGSLTSPVQFTSYAQSISGQTFTVNATDKNFQTSFGTSGLFINLVDSSGTDSKLNFSGSGLTLTFLDTHNYTFPTDTGAVGQVLTIATNDHAGNAVAGWVAPTTISPWSIENDSLIKYDSLSIASYPLGGGNRHYTFYPAQVPSSLGNTLSLLCNQNTNNQIGGIVADSFQTLIIGYPEQGGQPRIGLAITDTLIIDGGAGAVTLETTGAEYHFGNAAFTTNNGNIGTIDDSIPAIYTHAAHTNSIVTDQITSTVAGEILIDVTINNEHIIPIDSGVYNLGAADLYYSDAMINNVNLYGIVDQGSTVDAVAGDAAEINAISGRFRKDNSGAAFTLTNAFITSTSIILVTPANAAIDASATTWTVDAGSGSAVITFNAAPTDNFNMNFLVIN